MSDERPRVLWVEDESDTQKEMQETFGNVYDITFVGNSSDAKAKLAGERFQLMVVDLYLENKKREDGLSIIRYAKQEKSYRLAIVAISKELHKDLETARLAGADRTFSKVELDSEEWAEIFEKLIAKKKLFISYSRVDKKYLLELSKRLAPLRRAGTIEDWTDNALIAGEEWNERIQQELKLADIILFLLSPDAIASDYINDIEVNIAFERHAKKEVTIIPVIVRPCNWKGTRFSKLTALPKNGTPVSSHMDADLAWMEISEGITKVLNPLQ